MKKRRTTQGGFFNVRLLIAIITCAAAACSIITSIPTTSGLAFFRSEAPTNSPERTLTFAERVAYQRAIEDVYWRHRIWPRNRGDRPDPKPSLDSVMSQAQMETKVGNYLRDSQALEADWHRPITAEQLQAEMDRMAQHTNQPEVLREVFAALGNDAFVIAECLARPVLAEGLLRNIHDDYQEPSDSRRRSAENQTRKPVAAVTGSYTLPTVSDSPNGCIDDMWTATSTTNVPVARVDHTAVWTGIEMIVWGGLSSGVFLNSGGRYNPVTDSWTAINTANAPAARDAHTAVWSGIEMIVWGGTNGPPSYFNTGGRYNPSTDTWTPTSIINAPSPRQIHTAVWSDSEMIVWGGIDASTYFNTGGRYNPSTDSWTATSTTNGPAGRFTHTAVWTGSQMIVWGGWDGLSRVNTGGRYNPSTDSWTATTTTSAPLARELHTAVWTGSEMIVWGGAGNFPNGLLNTGGRYNPSNDSWTATSVTNTPSARYRQTAVWTGSEMTIWGGEGSGLLNTGGRYNASGNSWMATSTTNAPDGRRSHTAVWTGSEMIIWGGYDGVSVVNTGGRYCAAALSPTPTPTATATATPTPTQPPPSPTPTPTVMPPPTPTPAARPTTVPRPRPTPRPRP